MLGCLLSKRQTKADAGEHVEHWEPLHTVHGNVSWYSHYENRIKVPQEIKSGATI